MSIEAMKQALEALVSSRVFVTSREKIKHPEGTEWYDECIAALRTAIEAAEKQEPVAWMHTMIDDVVIGHRPADLKIHPDRWMPLYKDPTPCQTCQALARTVMMDQTAHDTQRQPLTDEKLNEIAARGYSRWVEFARAIEAAHGIKENT